MRKPLEHADVLLAEMETLTSAPDLMERLAAVRLILSDHAEEQKRLVPVPAVVVEDQGAVEIARIFEVQGQCIAGIRWNAAHGADYWGSAVLSLASSIGLAAEKTAGLAAADVAGQVLDAAIDEFEADVNPVVEHDPASHRPLN